MSKPGRKTNRLDDRLDEALAHAVRQAPAPDLRPRVVARVAAPIRDTRVRPAWWVAAAAAVIAVVALHPRRPRAPLPPAPATLGARAGATAGLSPLAARSAGHRRVLPVTRPLAASERLDVPPVAEAQDEGDAPLHIDLLEDTPSPIPPLPTDAIVIAPLTIEEANLPIQEDKP